MVNSVVLVGRLTRDPELRVTNSGISVVSFTLAVDRTFSKDQADFISCVAWKKTAEFMDQYVTKGRLIDLTGRIQTRNYDDKDGKKVYVTEVVADHIDLLDSRSQAQNGKNGGYTASNYQAGANYQQSNQQAPQPQNGSFNDTLDVSSDELPF